MATSNVATYLGAAAFSAGLGLAVLSGAGIAAADTDDAGTSQPSSSSESASNAGPKARTEKSAKPSSKVSEDDDATETVADETNSVSDDESSGSDAAISDADADSDEAEETVEEPAEDETDDVAEDAETIAVESISTAVVETVESTAAPAATDENLFTWLGRELDYFWLNRKPTAKPVQVAQSTTLSTVLGTLNVFDREGDPVAYRVVSKPVNGTVAVDENGAFVYTPNAKLAAAGGIDVFSVKVTDIGWGVHLFTGGRSTYVPVVVRLAPAVGEPLYTRGFDVYNLTSKPLIYQGYNGDTPESQPANGYVLAAGSSVRFELTYRFLYDTDTGVNFMSNTFNEFYIGNLHVEKGTSFHPGASKASCQVRGGKGTCTPSSEQDGNVIVFLDAPGTVITIGGGDGLGQYEVLNNLCYDGSPATCTFTATRQDEGFTPVSQIGDSVTNSGKNKVTFTLRRDELVGYSDSVGASAKLGLKIGDIVNPEITATYNHTWNVSHTFSQQVAIEVGPGTTAWIVARQPFYRVYGDFSLQLGNTTWNLTDVYFDTPNPDGNGNWDVECAPANTCSVVSVTDVPASWQAPVGAATIARRDEE